MSVEDRKSVTSRRGIMRAGLAIGLAPLAAHLAEAQVQARPVTKVLDFQTTADVGKAEQEGGVVFYTHDSDPAGAAITDAFSKDFPRIKGTYLRAQNGALYSKLLAERSAGRFTADVIQFSEVTTALDLKRRDGFELHLSPEAAAYGADNLSSPAGYYFHPGVTFGGIAYNTDKVPAADAPKTWKDLLDPRWRNAINTKQSTSGMQFVEWFELKRLYGDGYWKEFSKQRPRGFDSRIQLFDRLAKGDDKICALAEWAGYQLYKDRGAPIAFVTPPDGLPATPLAAGILTKAPHPEAARLFLDWMMSPRGQGLYQSNSYLYYPSLRHDAAPMPGGMKLTDFKLLYPQDLVAYAAAHDQYVKEWNGMLGL